MHLEFSLESSDLTETTKFICQQEPFRSSGDPLEISINGEAIEDIPKSWLGCLLNQGTEKFRVAWGEINPKTGSVSFNKSRVIILTANNCVKIRITDDPPKTIQEVINMIAPVPWTLASFHTTHDDWNSIEKQDEGTDYLGPMIGSLQYPLGWACAFKGEGHKHLASKRILDYGPWRVIRDEANDITLVQFYDLDVDADTALEQAKPGHKLMGDYAHGALMTQDNPFYGELNGIYQATKRKLEIVVAYRDLPLTEIIDACKAKYAQSLGTEQPIDNVAFIFTAEEDEAHKYLFDIWLRGLECWTFINHELVRVDEDYTPPPPQKPEWVKQLEAQEKTEKKQSKKVTK
jgi:hypothetical protein